MPEYKSEMLAHLNKSGTVPDKPRAAVVLEKASGGQVRLREGDALEGCSDTDKNGMVRWRLEPNKWCHVPEPAYGNLKAKFSCEEDRLVPDHDANFKTPHGKGGDTIMRAEPKPTYVMEFRD